MWFRQTAPVPNPVLLVKSPLLEIDHLPVVRNVNAVSAAVCKIFYGSGICFRGHACTALSWRGFWLVSDFRGLLSRRMGSSCDFLDGKDCLIQTVRLYPGVPSVFLPRAHFRRQALDPAHSLANTTAWQDTPAWYTFGTAPPAVLSPPSLLFFFVYKEKENSVPSVPSSHLTDGNMGGSLGLFTASRQRPERPERPASVPTLRKVGDSFRAREGQAALDVVATYFRRCSYLITETRSLGRFGGADDSPAPWAV